MKKAFFVMVIITVVLVAMIGYYQYMLNQYSNYAFGDVLGYFFYIVVAAGIIGVIWLVAKPAKKKENIADLKT